MGSEPMTMTFYCEPGKATPELAMKCYEAARNLMQAIADDIEPGAVKWELKDFHWIDDGKDEITVTFNIPPTPTGGG